MSSINPLQTYQELLTQLQNIQKLLNFESNKQNTDNINQKLSEYWLQIKQIYTEKIIPLTNDKVTNISTELHRNYRLLEIDIMRLNSSRQVATQQQRLQILRDRITQMIGYCELLLKSD